LLQYPVNEPVYTRWKLATIKLHPKQIRSGWSSWFYYRPFTCGKQWTKLWK